MIEVELAMDLPASVRYHHEAIEQILQSVEEGIPSALLGPRLCGKTILLRHIEQKQARDLGWICAYIDLDQMRATTQQVFFADLIQLTARRLSEITGIELPAPGETEASSAVFRGFLVDSLEIIGRDFILLIDPLEALPNDLVQALLTSLRAAYMDQQTMDRRATVVVSGALSLATLTVGESSPFRGIARRVFVGDLTDAESDALIVEFLAEYQAKATRQAQNRLLQATRGDIYLIRWITQRCAQVACSHADKLLRARDVAFVINRFLRQDVYQYATLLEAVRLIEEDPDLLECVLMLLERNAVPKSELPLPLSPDLDPLYLTGVVDQVDGDRYRLQNQIYRQFLIRHFIPGRVGHVLAMAGRWDSAIDYLEASIHQGDQQSRADILPATINSMYASQDLAQAVHFLRRGLSAAFDVQEASIWYTAPSENLLRLIGPADASLDGELWQNLQIPINADRLEARAFRQRVPLRGQEGGRRVARAIPMRIPGRNPIGVVTIYEDPLGEVFGELRERDLQLVGFLNQAARALLAVGVRRQELTLAGRMQASLLPEALPDIPGWELTATWRPARETSGDFYDFIELPGGKLGLVVADVVDKGMGAALMMALSRTLLRTYAVDFPDNPERVLNIANRRLIADVGAGLFVTLFYGVFDPAKGILIYCNAGHPPPYLFTDKSPNQHELLQRTGVPLGIAEDASWERVTVQLDPGSLLMIYTDGIQDSQNPRGEFYSEDRVIKIIQSRLGRPVQEIQDALLAGVYAFASGEPQVDDITLMILARSR